MRCEAREIKPDTEFVKVVDLVVGRVYFDVTYVDYDMIVPEITPLVFIGRDLHPDEAGFIVKMSSPMGVANDSIPQNGMKVLDRESIGLGEEQ
jgi:hypothetical protein